ncbi:4Fe-4S ferredoxin iron-sulfur binding domain protein [Desulfofarcimen acetoxidans DSM 771]|uniref:4Fe-4S ferredoxin iron-sulfur binding domain protein n=1 Tax=Desulfofarcimen acetoxidans (strain ATCC 49208 / DSM 771 / KCTC 5769 / VKM B-1644 / 5575) TaxID=485916 RepID=C8W6J9_DESAS|nr:FAD-dependent oxidoreductase [Desulfofarcimen acetoxidans]ACV64108.1 4Fe-4S ferredoxin iron-sulfur binding domain protein [Desulfofarcimen acetoxidans DSM 771]
MKSVMVVGAGLAGTKIAIDLAEVGFEVYLVEKSASTGGTMQKLDKMFPTHDCSLCTLAPDTMDFGCKLSSVNSHPNIKTIVNAEILDFAGIPNNFEVTIRGTLHTPEERPVSCDKDFNLSVIKINIDFVILSTGFKTTDPSEQSYYGYGKYPNVITSLEFEALLKEARIFHTKIFRPGDRKKVEKIAWLQCVGSRNERIGRPYCSSICCMVAVKEAIMAREISSDTKTNIFLMDIRSHGKGYHDYQQKAEKDFQVGFIYSRIYGVSKDPTGNLVIRYATENGNIITEDFDLVVLSTGIEQPEDIKDLAEKFGIMLDEYNFALTQAFSGVCSSRPGIFIAGAFAGPMDIQESLTLASACVAEIISSSGINEKRIGKKPFNNHTSRQLAISEEPNIGVFLCSCNSRLDNILDFPKLTGELKNNQVHIFSDLCSLSGKEAAQKIILQKRLNRIVIAACSSKINSSIMKKLVAECGLSENMLQIVNIREQCAWVHMDKPKKATYKALEQIRMAVIKLSLSTDFTQHTSQITQEALIVGGGLAGLTSALYLAKLGCKVHLVEKTAALGGLAAQTMLSSDTNDENISKHLNLLINETTGRSEVNIYLNTEVKSCTGYVGNFISRLSDSTVLNHAVTIIAAGGQEAGHNNDGSAKEYLYGKSKLVYTQMELEALISLNDPLLNKARNIVMIQCVGSREKSYRHYCSRICCTQSIKQALRLKERDPHKNIFILYRDITTYGSLEKYYTEARSKGIIFIRYNINNKPTAEEISIPNKKFIKILVDDHILGNTIELETDILCLATGIEASPDNPKIASVFNVSLDDNNFFKERHIKLKPVDLNNDGIFACGLSHAPKSAEETITQAKAAVGRACTILCKGILQAHKTVAVNTGDCAACLTCLRTCPYSVPKIVEHKVFINPVQCRGCGICTSECPLNALELQNLSNEIMDAMIESLF